MIAKKLHNSKIFAGYKLISPRRHSDLLILVSLFFILLITLGLVAGLSMLKDYADTVPTEAQIREVLANKGENSRIYDRNGVLLYTFKDPNRDREYADIKEIPPTVVAAVLAAEDRDFFVHEGIDFLGTINGLYTTISSGGEDVVGGSTITQQLVKQTLLTNEKTFDRKAKEAIMAMIIEQNYTKEEILEYYLNSTTYGGRIQGIRTAAKAYFGKDVKELSLNEAAFLVALVQSPGEYSPLFSPDSEKAKILSNERRIFILNQVKSNPAMMVYLNTGDVDYLSRLYAPNQVFPETVGQTFTAESLAKVIATPVTTKEIFTDILRAPHWVFYIRDQLGRAPYNLSHEDLYSGGYEIYTSLDINIQNVAQAKMKEAVDRYGRWYRFDNGSAVTVDARNGEILAMVGSKGYNLPRNGKRFEGKFNVATAPQLLGSSLKPFAAYLGFDSGKYNRFTTVFDTPKTFAGGYRPKNYDSSFQGTMTLSLALINSRNLPFLKLVDDVGVNRFLDLMKKAGYKGVKNYGLSAVIGGVDESLLDHTLAYTGFANGGKIMKAKPILRIVDRDGKVVFRGKTEVRYQMNESAVSQVNSIIGDKRFGYGANALKFIGYQKLAGKTGTSDKNKDTWYVGYGPKIVTGVWVGNNDNTPMIGNSFGVNTSLPVWNTYMREFFRRFPQYGTWGSY